MALRHLPSLSSLTNNALLSRSTRSAELVAAMSDNLNRAVLALDALRPIAKALPVAGRYLEGVFELLALACQHAKDVKKNREDMMALAERAVLCVAIIVEKAQKMPEAQINNQMSTIHELEDLTEELAQKAKRQAERSRLSRNWHKSDDKEEVEDLSQRFGEVVERFGVEAQLFAMYGIENVLNQVNTLRDEQNRTEKNALLEKLRPVAAARHDHHKAPRGCIKNTRVGVIDYIIRWASDTSTLQNIFWLTGLAGTGKTAIMITLCKRLTELGALGGSFFVSVNSADRRDPLNILHTLVYQLAWAQPILCEQICSILHCQPYLLDQAMTLQIAALLSDPFAQILDQIDKPVVILIDALDECETVDGVEGGEFLPVLLSTMRQHPGKLKLIVTSRLTPGLRRLFDQAAVDRFLLHEIEKETVNDDLRLYLEAELAQITQVRGLQNDPCWYSSEDVIEIVNHAGSLFIYVFTVIKWINNLHFMPEDRLRQVLQWLRQGGSKSPFQAVDDLYNVMLQNALGPDESDHEEIGNRMHKLLEVLVVAFEPLPISGLAQLLGCDENIIRLDLDHLSAAIVVPEKGLPEPVAIYHASFLDYLTDEKRCPPKSPFHVSVGQAHGQMGAYCLDLEYDRRYSKHERKNANQDSESQRGFSYASHNWRGHLARSPHSSNFVDYAIQKVREVVTRHPENKKALRDLSNLLLTKSSRTSDIEILHEKIAVDRRRIDLVASSYHQKAFLLNNLANGLQNLYERSGDEQALNEKITLNRKALELCPPGHPNRDASLNNLATGLQSLYERNGDEQILDEKINLSREALKLRPPGHPLRDRSLNTLAIGLQSLYERNGDKRVLNRKIKLNREALELRPYGHLLRDRALNTLAIGLQSLYDHTGDEQVLNEEIILYREALELRPPGHPLRDRSLNALAVGLQSLYERHGDEQVLEKKIRLSREALELRPPGHLLRSASLNNLAIGLQSLYERNGDEEVLDESARLSREALELCLSGHLNRGESLIHLASGLQLLYKRGGDKEVLQEAVILHREALELCPFGHHLHHTALSGLALSLYQSYEQSKDIITIEEAVKLERDALSLCPKMHPNHSRYLRTLSNCLKAYGDATGNQMLISESEKLSKRIHKTTKIAPSGDKLR